MTSRMTSRSSGRAARQACTRFWPMKPAPPVIRTLCIATPWLADIRRCMPRRDQSPPFPRVMSQVWSAEAPNRSDSAGCHRRGHLTASVNRRFRPSIARPPPRCARSRRTAPFISQARSTRPHPARTSRAASHTTAGTGAPRRSRAASSRSGTLRNTSAISPPDSRINLRRQACRKAIGERDHQAAGERRERRRDRSDRCDALGCKQRAVHVAEPIGCIAITIDRYSL